MPLISSKNDIITDIFPAIDVMVMYYISSYLTLRYLHIFFIGLVLDQIYLMPIGSNSLIYLLAMLFITFANKHIVLKNDVTNCSFFAAYSLLIIILKLIILATKQSLAPGALIVVFQYLTTIFSYPLIKLIMDKITIIYRKSNASF
jgi:hypothetical protein